MKCGTAKGGGGGRRGRGSPASRKEHGEALTVTGVVTKGKKILQLDAKGIERGKEKRGGEARASCAGEGRVQEERRRHPSLSLRGKRGFRADQELDAEERK